MNKTVRENYTDVILARVKDGKEYVASAAISNEHFDRMYPQTIKDLHIKLNQLTHE